MLQIPKRKYNRPKLTHTLLALPLVAILGIGILLAARGPSQSSKLEAEASHQVSSNTDRPVEVSTFTQQEIEKPAGYTLSTATLPAFISNEAKLIIKPSKYDIGSHKVIFYKLDRQRHQIDTITYIISTRPKAIDKDKLLADLKTTLGASREPNFGIYIYDLLRNEAIELNSEQIIPPGSISKLPVAILTLRDIDSGKFTFDSTYPVQNKHKHSTYDSIGALAEGTKVTLRTYLRALILQSNNTAQYHLRENLGSTGVLNERTINELGVNPYFEDPHIATAKSIGIVMTNLYQQKYLSKPTNDFLLGLMTSIDPTSGLRNGIPYGLRNKQTERVANKVGFLFGGNDNVYNDSAIVWGPKTDYVVVIMNKSAPPYPSGSQIIAQLSPIIYDALQI